MRFATAIAILAQGVVSAKEPTSGQLLRSHGLTKGRGAPGKRGGHFSSRVLARDQTIRSRDLRQNTAIDVIKEKIADLRSPTKCDPAQADVGILELCPPQEYCSDLGFCTPKANMIRQVDSNTTTIEDVYGDFLDLLFAEFNYYNYFCNASSPIYNIYADQGKGYDCDCAEINVATQEGMVNCTIPATCYGDVCYEAKFALGFVGNFSEYEFSYYCINFTAPYEQEICYYYGYSKDKPDTCIIGIDGVDCTSCSIQQYVEEGGGPRSDCIAFDCTNIAKGNAGTDCAGDFVSDIFENLPTFVPVEATVSFLESLIFGISTMSVDEQLEWATLTAEYMVKFYETIAQDILRDLVVIIEVLAIIPAAGGGGRLLHEQGDSLKIIYNTALTYRIDDPSLISPLEVAQLPFFTAEDRAAYARFMREFGSGNLANILAIEFLGQREAIRAPKSAKKSKKASKSAKSEKKSKGTTESEPTAVYQTHTFDERTPLYQTLTIEDIEADYFEIAPSESKNSKVGKSEKKGRRKRG